MNKKLKELLTVVLTGIIAMSMFLIIPTEAKEAYASNNEVTIVGTIVKTREYFDDVEGPVATYGFIPEAPYKYTLGEKPIEITEFAAGASTSLGSKELSSLVGTTKSFTGVIDRSPTEPYEYMFAISSYTEVQTSKFSKKSGQ